MGEDLPVGAVVRLDNVHEVEVALKGECAAVGGELGKPGRDLAYQAVLGGAGKSGTGRFEAERFPDVVEESAGELDVPVEARRGHVIGVGAGEPCDLQDVFVEAPREWWSLNLAAGFSILALPRNA